MRPRLLPPPPRPRAADRGADVRHRRVGQHDVERLRLQLRHRLEGDVGGGLGRAHDEAGVVLGEHALGDLHVEVHRERRRRTAARTASPPGCAARRAACAHRPTPSSRARLRRCGRSGPCFSSLCALRKCAQIIGVTDSETTIETAMATTSVTENSRSRRPATPPMNSTRDEGGDQRHADRDDGEADLPRADERGLHRRHAAPRGCGRCSRS